ncbi:glycoside hydrolase family 105 protein [Didymella exigua CBS 183.55]|uniref:Glycoside hydrolase family 105 protein n=1 Tax=Didymella exigua CBS 183.55 TaxID=1150837 RepID=A0A6A5R5Z1_9PLEO|nr:glycoside hydrolase family 105 protein [Didymella exigua CBS 183.55]KAF1923525.1 glycoside hydrolase family 105 protein [Didymella exigua CBS 183.55]
MARSIMSRRQGIYTSSSDASGALQAGLVQKTFSALMAQYPNHTLAPALSCYTTASADSLLPLWANTTTALKFSLDRLSAGNALVGLSAQTGEDRYQRAGEVLRASIDANSRSSEGGLWYYVYPNWSYLDGMFSFGPFWALWTATHDARNATAWAELKSQFGLLARRCQVEGSDLLVHGYDDSRTAVWANNSRGQSPHVWGRSLGWYVLGLLETISELDRASAGGALRDDFVAEFQRRMGAVVDAVDAATGAWWQLLDAPGRQGNYVESSASAMFTWALLRGAREGHLNATHVDVGRRAYAHLKDTFVVHSGNGTLGWNGTVSVCSLNSTASFEYYTTRPILYNSVLGSAAFVGASLEVERLGC